MIEIGLFLLADVSQISRGIFAGGAARSRMVWMIASAWPVVCGSPVILAAT